MPATALSARPGFPALVTGCSALFDLALLRALLRADEARVYFLGRALDWQCAFRAATGLPCPTCGLTRSIVLSLHGEFGRAWKMAPAGPVAVVGLAAFALIMVALALLQSSRAANPRASEPRWIRRGALAYAAGLVIVWLGGWVVNIHALLAAK